MGTSGSLQISNNQEAIVLNDEFFGEPNKSSVRQESGLVPYKPNYKYFYISVPALAAAPLITCALQSFHPRQR